MMKQWKRFAAGILCAAMLVTSLPLQAFAAEETQSVSSNTVSGNGLEDELLDETQQNQTVSGNAQPENTPLEGEQAEEETAGYGLQKDAPTGAEKAGSFVLAAFSQNVAVIEPVTIAYEAGNTVKDALMNSKYAFGGIETGFIQSVEGTGGNYSMVFADGGYGLDTAADKVGTMFLSERTDVNITTNPELVTAVSNALKSMAAYNEATNNVQNYPSAQSAYKATLTNMRTGAAETIRENTEALDKALEEYEAFLVSGKRKVTVNVTQGGVAVTDAKLTFIDEYGNVTEATGNEIELLDGKYTFVVTDAKKPYNYTTNVGKMNAKSGGNWNTIEEYFTVSESSTVVNVKLASGEWFGDITAEANASQALNNNLTEYDKENHKVIFYVADSFDGGTVKPTINKADGTPVNTNSGTKSSLAIFPWVDFVYAKGSNAGKWVSDVATSSNTNKASFGSARTCLNFIDVGMTGNTMDMDIRWLDDTEDDATGYIVMQGYDLEVKRFPTLSSMGVTDTVGTALISAFDPYSYSYDITTIAGTFKVDAVPYGENYTVEIKAGENTTIDGNNVTLTGETGSFTVSVTTEGVITTYTINLTKVPAVDVTLEMDDGVTAQVLNVSGSVIEPKEAGGKVYALVPGETYTYIGTKDEYYHTTSAFEAAEDLSVSVAAPEVKTVIQDFVIYDSSNKSTRVAYKWDSAFTPGDYSYIVEVPDAKSGAAIYVQSTSADTDYKYYVSHLNQTTTASHADKLQDWITKNITSSHKVSSTGSALTLGSRIVAKSGQSNILKMQVRKTSGTVTYYQEFVFDLVRVLTLADLKLSSEAAGELGFVDNKGDALSFDRDVLEYNLKISADTQKLNLTGEFQNTANTYSFDGGYYAMVNGVRYDDISSITLDLDVNKEVETVEVQVCHRDTKAVSQTYKVNVKKQQPIKVIFDTDPEKALVYIVNQLDNKTLYADDSGVFTMMPEVPYTYTVSATGYKTVQVTDFTLEERSAEEPNTETIEVKLEKAPAPTTALPNYSAQWPTFRADSNGNGVVSSKTPIKAEETVLYWASKIGEGFDSGATGCPILVNGYLYTYAGNSIVKVDVTSGEVVASAKMYTSSSFAINSPTYAEGMIFVGLGGGKVQAFNADTLESLWLYTDPLGGQPNCSIEYFDGHIYTGFWNSETKPANFVCISVTDEEPSQTTEAKLASWRYTHNGFYWAGAYACEDFVLVGTDDGENGYTTGHASVLSFDPATGKFIDEIELTGVGDLRSDIMYDEKGTGDYYFTTKGGHIYRLQVNKDGTFKNLMSLKLYNYANNDSTPPMSTCTPVIYNGRAYIGVSGTGQFSNYSGHNITVVDLASWSIAYTVRTQGYPQTSGLLTTAYEEETGYAYVYFVDNATPGKIRVLSDKPGQTAPNEVTKEGGYDTAYVLFTPTGAQAQYAICSPIADENGFIYFKNDSANMMCVGPVMEKIEVTKLPDRTTYAAGAAFDATGMQVIATYSNGTTKDISNYISFSEEPLTINDTDFMIEFKHVMYQDKGGKTGVEYTAPFTTVKLEITVSVQDVINSINGIGEVTLDKEEAIETARASYEALPEADRSSVTNYETLTAAERTLAQLKADKAAADALAEKILSIAPNPSQITLASEAAIVDAQQSYAELSDGAKAYFTKNHSSANGFMNIAIQRLNQLKQNAADQDYADAVTAKINAIGEVTLSREAAITQARDAYEYLTDAQKAMVSAETLAKLTDAETALKALKDQVAAAEAAIDAIGEVTVSKEVAITQARDAYDKLAEDQKAAVKNLDILTKAEESLKDCKAAAAVDAKIDAIGTVTVDSEDVIKEARQAYEALTEAQKELVQKLDILKAAEQMIDQLIYNITVQAGVTEIKGCDTLIGEEKELAEKIQVAVTQESEAKLVESVEGTRKKFKEAAVIQKALEKQGITVTITDVVETKIVPHMSVVVKAVSVTEKQVTLDIQMLYDVEVTINSGTPVKIVDGGKVADTDCKPITILVQIPANIYSEQDVINAGGMYVAHKKGNGSVYNYTAVLKDGEPLDEISFTNIHGYSEFTLKLGKKPADKVVTGQTGNNGTGGENSNSENNGSSGSHGSSSSSSSKVVTTQSAATGDYANLILPVLLLVVAVGGIAICFIFMRRRNKV